mgnify:CR=1 FL=1
MSDDIEIEVTVATRPTVVAVPVTLPGVTSPPLEEVDDTVHVQTALPPRPTATPIPVSHPGLTLAGPQGPPGPPGPPGANAPVYSSVVDFDGTTVYLGESSEETPDPSAPVWRIGVMDEMDPDSAWSYALAGSFTAVWDSRSSYDYGS